MPIKSRYDRKYAPGVEARRGILKNVLIVDYEGPLEITVNEPSILSLIINDIVSFVISFFYDCRVSYHEYYEHNKYNLEIDIIQQTHPEILFLIQKRIHEPEVYWFKKVDFVQLKLLDLIN